MKLRILGAICLLILGIACFLGYEAWSFLNTPPSATGKEIYFDVPAKAGLSQIARELQAKGLITDAKKFSWLVRWRKLGQSLQAGRFAMNTAWLPDKVLNVLAFGKPVLYRVTVPEGLTWWQTGQLLEDAGLARFEDFKNVISDPQFLRHYGIPFATAEGFLMPDTYLLHKPDTPMPKKGEAVDENLARQWQNQARAVAGRMVDNFWRKADPLWNPPGKRPDAQTLKNRVILASIVEKETGIDQERSRVAGVYANRIAKNMLLQADPTVIYGLGPDFQGQLRKANLDDRANPYNTYQLPGLTPGPICSFGVAALKAAINPEKHDFIYFVAKTDGGEHTFSKNLAEHNKAVEQYRRQKQTKKTAP